MFFFWKNIWHYIVLYCVISNYFKTYSIILNYNIILYHIHDITSNYIVHCFTLANIILHFITFHYILLHHCITLYYIVHILLRNWTLYYIMLAYFLTDCTKLYQIILSFTVLKYIMPLWCWIKFYMCIYIYIYIYCIFDCTIFYCIISDNAQTMLGRKLRKVIRNQWPIGNFSRWRSNEVLKFRGASKNGQNGMVAKMRMRGHQINHAQQTEWTNESMNEWLSESMNQGDKGNVNQWIDEQKKTLDH